MHDGRAAIVLAVVGIVGLLACLLVAVLSEPHYSEFVLSCGNHIPAHTVTAPEPAAMSVERMLELIERMLDLAERQGCGMWQVIQ